MGITDFSHQSLYEKRKKKIKKIEKKNSPQHKILINPTVL